MAQMTLQAMRNRRATLKDNLAALLEARGEELFAKATITEKVLGTGTPAPLFRILKKTMAMLDLSIAWHQMRIKLLEEKEAEFSDDQKVVDDKVVEPFPNPWTLQEPTTEPRPRT